MSERRWFGLRGATAAFMGLFLFPYCWVLGLAFLYADYATHPTVRAIVTGIGAAGAGLFLGMGIKLARPIARRPAGLAIVAGCFLGIAIARVSLFIVLPLAGAVALAFAWRGRL